jgi:hypothetical protein
MISSVRQNAVGAEARGTWRSFDRCIGWTVDLDVHVDPASDADEGSLGSGLPSHHSALIWPENNLSLGECLLLTTIISSNPTDYNPVHQFVPRLRLYPTLSDGHAASFQLFGLRRSRRPYLYLILSGYQNCSLQPTNRGIFTLIVLTCS